MRKGSLCIDDRSLKCKALTLVDRDRPCQFERILDKGSQHLLFDLFRRFIQRVFDILPLIWKNEDVRSIACAANANRVVVDLDNLTDLAIKVPLLGL